MWHKRRGPLTDRYRIGVTESNKRSSNRMSELQELLEEALWSIREGKGDVSNAIECLDRAIGLGSPVSKRKLKTMKTKSRKKPKASSPLPVTLLLVGKLPNGLTSEAFRAAVIPMMEDVISGEVMYLNYVRMHNGTICYNFSGMCPMHHRVHNGGAKIWQLKQHPKSEWCGFKCWKQDSYSRQFSNPLLC